MFLFQPVTHFIVSFLSKSLLAIFSINTISISTDVQMSSSSNFQPKPTPLSLPPCCLQDIRLWFSSNFQKLAPNPPYLRLMASKFSFIMPHPPPRPHHVKRLGVMVDSTVSLCVMMPSASLPEFNPPA